VPSAPGDPVAAPPAAAPPAALHICIIQGVLLATSFIGPP